MQQLALTLETEQERRFREFHGANPHVYLELVRLAREAKARGFRRFGVRTIWEVMRWNLAVRTIREEGDFKLNDHLTSRYARLLDREPDLHGFFNLRELRS